MLTALNNLTSDLQRRIDALETEVRALRRRVDCSDTAVVTAYSALVLAIFVTGWIIKAI